MNPQTPAPINTKKLVITGWILFGIALLAALISLMYGYVIAISAVLAAIAARLGLQAKNAPLKNTSLVLVFIVLALYIGSVLFR